MDDRYMGELVIELFDEFMQNKPQRTLRFLWNEKVPGLLISACEL